MFNPGGLDVSRAGQPVPGSLHPWSQVIILACAKGVDWSVKAVAPAVAFGNGACSSRHRCSWKPAGLAFT